MASVSPIMTDKDVAKFFNISVRTLTRRLEKPLAGEIDPNLGNPRKIGYSSISSEAWGRGHKNKTGKV